MNNKYPKANIVKLETAEIKRLITSFGDRTLPKENWIGNDKAHLIIGAWYCWRFNRKTSLDQLRAAIILFNESKGVQNTATTGYHETITVFWINIIFEFISKLGDKRSFIEVASAVVSTFAGRRDIYADYYSFDVFHSKEARKTWIQPDLKKMDA